MRHGATASGTLTRFQLIHWWFRSRKAAPAVRMRPATFRGGQLVYSSSGDVSFSFNESRGLEVAWR